MTHRIVRIMLAAVALVALTASTAIAAPKTPNPGKGHAPGAQHGVTKAKGGSTVLTVDSGTLAALTAAGVAVTPFGTATAASPVFTFPITAGRIVYKKTNHGKGKGAHKKVVAGNISHAGSGLTLTKGTLAVTVSNLRVNLSAGNSGRIDATLSTGGRLKLATLSNVAVNATSKSISATATLTPQTVSALNGAYGTTLPAGAALGTLVSSPTS